MLFWAEMNHVTGRMEWDGLEFHHVNQNDTKFKPYEPYMSRVFHLIFSDYRLPWVIETQKAKLQ